MSDILGKVRKLNWLLQESPTGVFSFNEMCSVLSDLMDANIYVANDKGKVLGVNYKIKSDSPTISDPETGNEVFPGEYNEELLKVKETTANLTGDEALKIFKYDYDTSDKLHTVIPIVGGGTRWGTLIMTRYSPKFNDEDLVLGEYGAAVIGLEIQRRKSLEREEEERLTSMVQMAIGTLSYSEIEAVQQIFAELDGNVCGGIWAFIPAIFKAKLGTNETIFTLMMNYVAIKFVTYLQYGPWMDPAANGFPKIAMFPDNAVMPKLGGVNIGWILAILAAAFVYFFMNYTKKGYEITVVGESIETARYAGMNISRIIVVAMLISGGLCGITGMIQASAIEKTLVYGIANGYGFTAIITAWLSKLNAGYAVAVCAVFAMLIQGGQYIQIALGVPSAVSDIVQGLILFFVLGSEFFMRYRVHIGRNSKEVA